MIPLPQSPKVILEEKDRGVFEIEGLYPGYGITLGNALRRVLLSSLPGAATTSFKIKGVNHEFSTIPGILEDVIELSLNVKKLRLKLFTDEPQKLKLYARGEKIAKAKDIEKNPQVEIVNPELHIATLTAKNAELDMELTVEKGVGYSPLELRKKEKLPIGVIALDAIFSPIKKVNFEVENMRVGERTDFNRLRMHIETDGTLPPREALREATQILLDHFSTVKELGGEEEEGKAIPEAGEDISKLSIEELNLSKRTINALLKDSIKTVGGLTKHRLAQLAKVKGLGEKGIAEIKRVLGKHGLEVKE